MSFCENCGFEYDEDEGSELRGNWVCFGCQDEEADEEEEDWE